MTSKIRDYQSYLYIVGVAVGVALLVITSNVLIFKSTFLPDLSSLGNWTYWIFLLAVIMVAVFFYLFYRVLNDTRKFKELIASGSKNNFVKNLRDLETISRRLGPTYVRELRLTKEKWKVK